MNYNKNGKIVYKNKRNLCVILLSRMSYFENHKGGSCDSEIVGIDTIAVLVWKTVRCELVPKGQQRYYGRGTILRKVK